jgi:class 3 adenylate cyclase/DNA-binding SARP family transcriptional activator
VARARTVSVLFIDVVGSTELLTRLGDTAADELRRSYVDALSGAVGAHHGEVVKSLGDGIMAVFDSAAEAVDAGVAMQQITTRVGRDRDIALRARVGVASGDAGSEDGDWHGTPVVEASRLCDAARAGQVLVADLTRRLAGSRTTRAFTPLGPLALKGLPEPVVVHEVVEASATRSTSSSRAGSIVGGLTRVGLVGSFGLDLDGAPVAEAALGSRKARTLLKLLAVRRGRLVPMDTIVDVLWPDTPPAKAVENVATLISRLRAIVGTDVLDGGRSGYRLLIPAGCHVDLDEAELLAVEAEHRLDAGQPALAATAAGRALDLLGDGRVLQEEADAAWADEANRIAARLLRRASVAAWRSRLALGDVRGALAAARHAVDADPLDEEAHRAVMLAYHRLGEQGEALAAYKQLRDVLVEELGADPGAETEELYLAILRGEQVTDATATAASGGASSDFVGRERELDALLDAWTTASQGAAACALIIGEPGIGKTRLASELGRHARATGALVVETRCFEAERSLFLQPVVEAIRAIGASVPPDLVREAAGPWAGVLATVVPDLSRILGPAVYEPTGGEVERRRTFEALASFLAALTRRRPLLLQLDDLQEAGASTVELCHFAVRWEPAARLLITATVRAEEGAESIASLRPVATALELGALPDAAVRALAENAGQAELAPALVQLTKGHPLFVLEALRAVADEGGEAGTIRVPSSLRDAVLARLDRCGAAVAELLRAAVVVGSVFQLDHLTTLLGVTPEDAARRAEVALRARLIVEAGTGYEFANDLIREVIYDSVPAPTRAVRHRRLAAMLADRPEAAAGHAAAAGDTAAAVDYWIEAATRALSSFANVEAELLLSRALDTADAASDPVRCARAHFLRANARLGQGRYDDTMADLAAAEKLAQEAGDGDLEAEAMAQHAMTAYHARNMPAARELVRRATVHPQAKPMGAVLLGRIRQADEGDLAGAEAMFAPFFTSDDPAVRSAALSFQGSVLGHQGRYHAALEVLRDAIDESRRAGALRSLLHAQFFGAVAYANLGELGTALTWAEQLRNSADRYGSTPYLPRALNSLAMVWRELGDFTRARDLAQLALEAAHFADGSVEGEPAAHAFINLADAALRLGHDDEAAGYLEQIDSLAGYVAFAWRVELLRLEVSCRLRPDRDLAESLLDTARRYVSAKYEAIALGYLGRHDEAVKVAEATGSPLLVARVGPPDVARRALDAVAAGLTPELRETFLRGRSA